MASTRHSAEGTKNRGLSPALWQEHFLGKIQNDPSRIGFFFDDFAEGTAYAAEDSAKYSVFADATAVLAADPSVDLSKGEFGVCLFNSDAGDNDQLSIQMGGGVGNLVKIDDTTGEDGIVAFEARIKLATVTTGDIRVFVGLAEEARSVDNGIFADNAATFADVDYIGFMIKEADGASLVRQFHKASGTLDAQDTGEDMEANIWVKLGLLYEPQAADDKKIRFFVDGEEVTTKTTRVTATDLADTTNFPAGEEMSPIVLLKMTGNSDTADYLYLDWWAVGQGFTAE